MPIRSDATILERVNYAIQCHLSRTHRIPRVFVIGYEDLNAMKRELHLTAQQSILLTYRGIKLEVADSALEIPPWD